MNLDQAIVARIFQRYYRNQPNILTPHVLRYRKKRHLLIECSKGEGMRRQTRLGFTVLEVRKAKPEDPTGWRRISTRAGRLWVTDRHDLSASTEEGDGRALLEGIYEIAREEHKERRG